jgi:predicted nuclease of predicted toxin-antitoxin system
MRLLLDECVPKRLKRELQGHEVRTVSEMGWHGKENGDLLGLAESKFDVLITVDQKLKYQQSVGGRDVAVVVLFARRNKIEFLVPLVPVLERVLAEIKAGELREVGAF